MKKRILSLLLCLLFFVALFPMTSLATGERYLEIDGTNFPDENFRQWVRDNRIPPTPVPAWYSTRAEMALDPGQVELLRLLLLDQLLILHIRHTIPVTFSREPSAMTLMCCRSLGKLFLLVTTG